MASAMALAALPEAERTAWITSLTAEEGEALTCMWPFWARPSQLAPEGEWRTWLILAGRGWGKTRTGAEFIREGVEGGHCSRVALVGATAADARDVMVEGESGLIAISPRATRPIYEPSKRRLSWPNGAVATLYSADEPDRLRGPQHDVGWADELAAWRYPDAWDQLQLGLRLGSDPKCVVSTTPRPTPEIRALVKSTDCIVTRGSTYENEANLAKSFIAKIKEKYEGTRLGRQELWAEILDDSPGALWKRATLDQYRVSKLPEMRRVAVGVDPAISTTESSAETGILVAGLGRDGHAYVFDDASGKYSPNEWADKVVLTYRSKLADCIVAEINQGGDLVVNNIHTVDKNANVKKVRATRGKALRAEPISALYEQGRVHHVGYFPILEDQLCTWDAALANKSPDRLDALVWVLTELMLGDAESELESPGVIYTDLDSQGLYAT